MDLATKNELALATGRGKAPLDGRKGQCKSSVRGYSGKWLNFGFLGRVNSRRERVVREVKAMNALSYSDVIASGSWSPRT